MAFAIYFHIRNRESDRTLEIFDEKLHPLSVSQHALIFFSGGGVSKKNLDCFIHVFATGIVFHNDIYTI